MTKVTRWNSCVTLKNALLIIRDYFGLSFATNGLGYLATLYLPLPLRARYKLSCYQTTRYRQFQCLQRLLCWKALFISFCSLLGLTLLLIKRTMINPLYLWVITGGRVHVRQHRNFVVSGMGGIIERVLPHHEVLVRRHHGGHCLLEGNMP